MSPVTIAGRHLTGAKPSPRHQLAGATPYQFAGSTPPQFLVLPGQLSYWGNQSDGDCVTAEEAFAKACHSPEIFITEQTVIDWARRHGVLNGAVIADVLDMMTTDGFVQDGVRYNDGPKTAIDWTNAALLQNAISKGPVKIGIVAEPLQGIVGQSNGWVATGIQPQNMNNLDHCVSLCGYGPASWLSQQLVGNIANAFPAYALFTWDTVGIIDVPSMLAITGEAWLRNPTTVVVGPQPTPTPPGPQPQPTPVPLPPDLKQQIDAIFAAASMRFQWYPPIVYILRGVQAAVDQALEAAGYNLTYHAMSLGGKIPAGVVQIVDAAFDGAIAAFPEYAVPLTAAKTLVHLALTMI